MAISLRTNSLAVSTANILSSRYDDLATSTQKLSTGLRINSAADDASGLAVRELMRADIAATQQGIRNATDAISMLQTADGALAIIDEKLIRMKELAEQAATGTYDSVQRLMIASEFAMMGSEIDRIARATDFNRIKLLDYVNTTEETSYEKFSTQVTGKQAGASQGDGSATLTEDTEVLVSDSAGVQYGITMSGTNMLNTTPTPGAPTMTVRSTELLYADGSVGALTGDTEISIRNTDSSFIGDTGLVLTYNFFDSTTSLHLGNNGQIDAYGDLSDPLRLSFHSADEFSYRFYIENEDFTRILRHTMDEDGDHKYWFGWDDVDEICFLLNRTDGSGLVRIDFFPVVYDTSNGTIYNYSRAYPNADPYGIAGIETELFLKYPNESPVYEYTVSGVTSASGAASGVYDASAGTYTFLLDIGDGNKIRQVFDISGTPTAHSLTYFSTQLSVDQKNTAKTMDLSLEDGTLTAGLDSNTQASLTDGDTLSITVTHDGVSDIYSAAYGSGGWENLSDNLTFDSNGQFQVAGLDGAQYTVTVQLTTSGDSYTFGRTEIDLASIELPDSVVKIHFGSHNFSDEDYYYIDKSNATLEGLGLDSTQIATQYDAQTALHTIDSAIVAKDRIRAYYGAMQNRLENTIAAQQIKSENLQVAESRISDADISREMTDFINNQILAQSATAMLAQANSLPRMVMQLIQ